MTQEEKDLLIKNICARLPYGVKVKHGDKPNIFDLENRGIIPRGFAIDATGKGIY